jgi:hypothetical protein
MSRDELIRKVTAAVDEAIKSRMYGTVEVEFRGGVPQFFRCNKQEKLADDTREKPAYGNRY